MNFIMKILNIRFILLIILIFSLSWNIYLYFNKWKQEFKNNNSCLIMYWDYYLNTPRDNSLDFEEEYTKQCLKESFWKTFYSYDWITKRILNDLKKYKEKKWDIPEFYKEILKDKFKAKFDNNTIDYSSIKLALDLIWDKNFNNLKVIKDIINFSEKKIEK